MKYLLLLLALAPLPSFAAECAAINHCVVEKKSWTKKGWKTAYSKELNFEKFCDERPNLELEKDLGIELWLLRGDASAKDYRAKAYVSVNLYGYKLTHVLASANAPATAEFINFSHRLTPKGPDIVEVTCAKK
ncbi:MAG: hypothetical protein ACXVBE_13555 [Bdellovibrionota bacterium]